jgi:hypothetical protein
MCNEYCSSMWGHAVDCHLTDKGVDVDTCAGPNGYHAHHPANVSCTNGRAYKTRNLAARMYAMDVLGMYDETLLRARKLSGSRYRVTKTS